MSLGLPWKFAGGGMEAHKINSHKINSHEVNSHEVNIALGIKGDMCREM